jgi:hypothetical protein
MTDPAKLANVRVELALLQDTWRTSAYASHDITSQWAALRTINEKLWDVEDLIRDKERARTFDQEFIDLARAVYVTNDERAAVTNPITDDPQRHIRQRVAPRGHERKQRYETVG